MRRLKPPAPDLLEQVVIPAGPIDLGAIFGECPVVLDVGCARARYTVKLGERYPELGVLGVENKLKRVLAGAKRVAAAGRENVRLLCARAEGLFGEILPPASVLAAFFICPDPWPKRRHGRRRLFQPDFVEMVRRALVPGGGLFVKTDDPGYYEWIREVVAGNPRFEPCPEWTAGGTAFDPTITSYYEERHAAEGRETRPLGWSAR